MASQSTTKKKKAVSSAKSWKKARPRGEELELPSGNVALVKRPGLEELLIQDMIPDSLTPLAEEAVAKGKAGKASALKVPTGEELLQDKQKISDIFLTMDRVAALVVMEPKVVHHRRPVDPSAEKIEWEDIPDDELVDEEVRDFLYTNEVDFGDKMFIFSFVVGGTRDLERFRKETGSALDDVSGGEDVEQAAE